MESSQIVDIWNTFKDSVDKKHIELVAEKFVEVLRANNFKAYAYSRAD